MVLLLRHGTTTVRKEGSQQSRSKQAKDYKSMTIQLFTTKSGSTLKSLNANATHLYQSTGLDKSQGVINADGYGYRAKPTQ